MIKEYSNKCNRLFKVSNYERNLEPKSIKEKEGRSISWGVKWLFRTKKPDADIIYHSGDVGKEPMIIIFGQSPQDVVNKVKKYSNI